ncbi:sodium:solute symporter family transporter [Echinicola rosea]|uniref:Sodium:solute symporter n=1 Tax=Echinicola rosea TaxID=1807691 RepID=A0ABQ1UT87_9BACT|nr:sodium/solute symporter [Echinicola rosea]GGF24513.1 sodium:solute symporter [Echinicola rosea]
MRAITYIASILFFTFFGKVVLGQGLFDNYLGSFTFEALPDMPAAVGDSVSLGYAGMFAGVHEDVLILAGGANFPDKAPWKGGTKHFSQHVYVLEKSPGGYRWVEGLDLKLPFPVAYGTSISTPKGLLCIGGNNQNATFKKVFLLKWDPVIRQVELQYLPDLPLALSNSTGGLVGASAYLAGGEGEMVSDAFFRMDLDQDKLRWERLPSWPGKPRSHAVSAVQNNGMNDCFYLFGGRRLQETGVSELYADAFCYDPQKEGWKKISSIQDEQGTPLTLSAGTAAAQGAGQIVFYGGVSGDTFNELERYAAALSEVVDTLARQELIQKRDILMENHPGFDRDIQVYHTITDSWHTMGRLPFTVPVTTTAVPWGGEVILPSGEISPGVRTASIHGVGFKKEGAFGWVNYTVLGLYLGSLVLMGVLISGKQHSTEDFFKASGRVPWWAAGISIFGTQLSAITFMAIPAKTFATDWTLFFLLMTIIIVAPIIIGVFLPFFRRLNITTAYEYLELRYNRSVRLIGSLIYVGLQLGRLGIVLLLPSLALTVVTGIDVSMCILIMGLLSIVYTVLGGIEAVIWTDVIQVVVLLGGALICLGFVFYEIHESPAELMSIVMENQKGKIFDMRMDFTGTSFWVVLIGGIAANIVQYGSDQTVVQRYLTTKDEKAAANGIATGALMALPSALIFFSMGTALYLFYKLHPAELSPAVQNTDSIFPFYIVTQLPTGISGLLIAAVFAAAMSSLDSSMNSVATVVTTDFYQKWFPKDTTGKNTLGFARWVTVIVGVFGTGFALVMASLGLPSLWDQFNMIIGLFAGGLGGIFLIGMLSDSVNGKGALLGLLCSALVQVAVKYGSDLSIHLYALTGLVSAMGMTYIGSFFFTDKRDIDGLTIHSLGNKKGEQENKTLEKA